MCKAGDYMSGGNASVAACTDCPGWGAANQLFSGQTEQACSCVGVLVSRPHTLHTDTCTISLCFTRSSNLSWSVHQTGYFSLMKGKIFSGIRWPLLRTANWMMLRWEFCVSAHLFTLLVVGSEIVQQKYMQTNFTLGDMGETLRARSNIQCSQRWDTLPSMRHTHFLLLVKPKWPLKSQIAFSLHGLTDTF